MLPFKSLEPVRFFFFFFFFLKEEIMFIDLKWQLTYLLAPNFCKMVAYNLFII